MTAVCKHMKGCHLEDRVEIYVVSRELMRELKQDIFCLNISNYLVWSRELPEVASPRTAKVFKAKRKYQLSPNLASHWTPINRLCVCF